MSDRSISYFIGPDKSGSTWIHQAVQNMEDVATRGSKDDRYFQSDFTDGDLATYQAAMLPTCATVGLEVDHEILFSTDAIERIANSSNFGSMLVSLRNPVKRAFSSYRYMQLQGRIPQAMTFSDALSRYDELVNHGRYHVLIGNLIDIVGRERVCLLPFGELSSNPQKFADRIRLSVGLDPLALDPEILAPSLAASSSRAPALTRQGRRILEILRFAGLGSAAHRIKSSPITRSIMTKSEASVGAQAEWSFPEVYQLFEEDISQLESLVNVHVADVWASGREVSDL